MAEARTMLVELAQDFAVPGSTIYQLGGNAADLLSALQASLDQTVRIELVSADLNRGVSVRDASVVLMVSTSRTVHPFRRVPLIEDVHRGLRAGGCALVVEQVRGRDSLLNNLFASHARERPHELRHSNDDLLVASSLNEECELLSLGGFRTVEVFYKWYGLAGLIAIK